LLADDRLPLTNARSMTLALQTSASSEATGTSPLPQMIARYKRIHNTAKAPIAISGIDTAHLPAPACMFTKGLPSPLAGGSGSSDPDPVADEGGDAVDEAPAVGVGAEGWAVSLRNDTADVGDAPATVDVTMLPVLMPVGFTTMGTTICNVLPSPSVVVRVIVVLTGLVKPSLSSSSLSLVVVVGFSAAAVVAGGARVVDGGT
jgi:hypothetical protein